MTTFSPEAYDSINPDQKRKQQAMLSPTPRVKCTGCGYMTRMTDTQRCTDCADRDERELKALATRALHSRELTDAEVAAILFSCIDFALDDHPVFEDHGCKVSGTRPLGGQAWLGHPWHERAVDVDGRVYLVAIREC